jgi:hypothetical protein
MKGMMLNVSYIIKNGLSTDPVRSGVRAEFVGLNGGRTIKNKIVVLFLDCPLWNHNNITKVRPHNLL